MTTRLEGLSIGLDLNTLKLNSGLTDLKSKLKTVNSEMKANMSAFDRGDRSIDKYQTRLNGLNKKLEVQKAITEKAQRHYKKMVKEHGEGSKEAEKAAREYNNQAAALNNLERYVEGVTDELKKMKEQQRFAESSWGKMADKFETIGTKLKSIGDSMKSVGRSMSMYVTAPIVGFGTLAAKIGIDFDDSMAKVQAVSGATGKDLIKLRDKAKDMGRTTKFSASDSAEALNYMAMAGWKTNDMLDGLDGVMSLAAASGEDLGTVSDIVTDALTAFGLKAKDSGRFADVLAAASSNANTNVSMLGKSFEYAAPVAGALGYRVEDTAVALGLMANAGIKADKSGTALRTMMTNLAKPTDGMQEAMDHLGISLTDSGGNMKTLDQVMQDLRKAFRGMDKDQQAAYAATIFGKEAMSGALAVINASEEDYNKLSKAINNSEGAAKKMSDIMEGTLGGVIREIKSGLEGFAISIYETMLPALEKGVQKVKGFVNWLNNLSPAAKMASVVIGGIAAAIGPLLLVGGTFIGFLGNAALGLSKLFPSIHKAGGLLKWLRLGFAALTGPIGITIGIVAGLTVGFTALYKKSETVRNGVDGLIQKFKGLGSSVPFVSKIKDSMNAFKTATDDVIPKVDMFGKGVSSATKKAVGGFLKLNENATQSLDDMQWHGKKVTEEMAGSIVSDFKKMNGQIVDSIQDRNAKSKDSLEKLFADSKALTDKEKAEALKAIDKRTQEEVKKTEAGQKRIQEIMNKASKEKREITDKERQEINAIQNEMVEHGVQVLSKNEVESKAILERMKSQAGNLSAQQAADVAKNSKKQRDKAVKEAEEQAKQTIEEAIYQRDVLGNLSAKQADKLIKEAERQRDKTVHAADDMHGKVISGAQEKAGNHAKLIDWETGEVLSKWDAFKNGVIGHFTDAEKGVFSGIKKIESGLNILKSAFAFFKADTLAEKGKAFEFAGKILPEDQIQTVYRRTKQIKDELSGFFDFYNQIAEKVNKGKDLLKGAFSYFKADTLMEKGKSIEFMQTFLPEDEMHRVIKVVQKVKGVISGITGFFKSKSEEVSAIWAKEAPKFQKIFSNVFKEVWGIVKTTASFFKDKIGEIKAFWDSDGAQILQAFKNVFGAIWITVRTHIDFLVKVFRVAFPVLRKIFEVTFKVLLVIAKSIWDNIRGVIDGAIKVIMGIIQVFSGLFTGDFKKMWEGIKNIFSGALKLIWNGVQLMMWGKLLKGILSLAKLLTNAFKSMWGGIKNIFSTVIKWIVDFVKNRFTAMKNTVNNILSIIKNVISTIWNGIKAVFSRVIKWIVDFVKNRFSGMKDTISSIFTKVRDLTKTIWDGIKKRIVDPVKSAVSTAKTKFTDFKDKTVEIFKNVRDKVKDYVADMVKKVKDMPGKMKDGLVKGAGKLKEGMLTIGRKMVDGLAAGVNGIFKAIDFVLGKLNAPKTSWKWVPSEKLSWYAHGTRSGGHPGGPAVVGDGKGSNAGKELVQTADGQTYLSPPKPTLVNLPKGTHVWSALETKSILGDVPHYAKGTLKDKLVDIWDYISKPGKLLNIALEKVGIAKPDNADLFGKIARGGFNMAKEKAVDFVKNKMADFAAISSGSVSFGAPFHKTSGYGPRWGALHKGVDYAAPTGTPIPAQAGGKVISAGFGVRGSGFGGYGNYVLVQGSGGLSYLYAHNSKNNVNKGDTVRKGQIIGRVGSTGDSTGPHVHFEIRKGGQAINPETFIGGGNVSGNVKKWIAAGMARAGVSGANWLNGLSWIINKESSGRPNAVGAMTSSGTAKGLMQLKDFNIRGNPFDPVNNVFHGVKYIKGRYKTIEKALAWWRSHNWYAKGTQNHKGGLAVLGDGGKKELFKTPQGQVGLSPNFATLMDLPRGSEVLSGDETQRAFDYLSSRRTDAMKLLALAGKAIQENKRPRQLPNVAGGNAGGYNQEFLNAILEQNQYLQRTNEILMKLLNKDINVSIDEDALTNKVNERNALKQLGAYFP